MIARVDRVAGARRPATLFGALGLAALLVQAQGQTQVQAQSIEARVNAARGEFVQLNYRARPGVCGDGRAMLRIENGFSVSTYGSYSDFTSCANGPVRALILRDGSQILRIQLVAGPLQTVPDAADIGTVSAAEAARYFIELGKRVDGRVARSAILAATLADSADLVDGLAAIASDSDRPRDLRRSAVNGLVNVSANGGVPALIRFSDRTDDVWLASSAIDALARTNDARARTQLRKVLETTNTAEPMRVRAITAFGGSDATARDAAYLRGAYPKYSERERSAALTAVANVGDQASIAWMLDRARDPAESMSLRRSAVQRAARAGARAGDLAKLYDGVIERELRDAIVDALADDGSRAATDKLLAVARSTDDARVRRHAVTKLGELGDARARDLLKTIVDRH
jgi:HEAT repeat protein